jgi:hypothetical protein
MSTNCASEKQITSRDLPRQVWQGPLPAGVRKIITRTEMDFPEGWAAWISDFALLSGEGIAHSFQRMTREAVDQSEARGWRGLPFVNWFFRVIGVDCLWAKPWKCGSTIECCRAGGLAMEILTIENMPVLCNPWIAVQLAEACYPEALQPFRWLPLDQDDVERVPPS